MTSEAAVGVKVTSAGTHLFLQKLSKSDLLTNDKHGVFTVEYEFVIL